MIKRILFTLLYASVLLSSQIVMADSTSNNVEEIISNPDFQGMAKTPPLKNSGINQYPSDEECRRLIARYAQIEGNRDPSLPFIPSPTNFNFRYCRERVEQLNQEHVDHVNESHRIRSNLANDVNLQMEQNQCLDRLQALSQQMENLRREETRLSEEYDNTGFLERLFGGDIEYSRRFANLHNQQGELQSQITALQGRCGPATLDFTDSICERYSQYSRQCSDALDYTLPDRIRHACTT